MALDPLWTACPPGQPGSGPEKVAQQRRLAQPLGSWCARRSEKGHAPRASLSILEGSGGRGGEYRLCCSIARPDAWLGRWSQRQLRLVGAPDGSPETTAMEWSGN